MMLMRARDAGITGYESRVEIDANPELLARLEPVRLQAGERMGLGDVSEMVIPKIGLLAAPQAGGDICSRYFTPWKLHAAHAVTGAACVASALVVEGTVVSDVARRSTDNPRDVAIEHPFDQINVRLETSGSSLDMDVVRVGILRHDALDHARRGLCPGRPAHDRSSGSIGLAGPTSQNRECISQ